MKKFILIAVLVFVFAINGFTIAESFKLADGTIIQGEITDHDDKGITLKKLNGATTVKLRWSQLCEKDRKRLRKQFGLEMPDYKGMISVKGDRIETFDGKAYVGRIVTENSNRIVIERLDEEEKKVKDMHSKSRSYRQRFKDR